MVLVTIVCCVVRDGSVVPVEIETNKLVGLLKEVIAEKLKYTGRADKMQLFLAKKGDKWLPDEDPAALELEEGKIHQDIQTLIDGKPMKATKALQYYLSEPNKMPQPSTGQIHVLVVVLEGSAATAQEEVKGPSEKRQKTGGISLSTMEKLVNLANLGQELNRQTDLAMGNVLEMPEELFGIRFHGGLYIRKEYWTLHNMVKPMLASGSKRVLVIGSPGIGKSVFGVFLLLVFMTERKDVAYRALGESVIYFFTWTEENGYRISDEPVGTTKYEGFFDGNESKALSSDDFLYKYLFASPRTENYNYFVKVDCSKVYMNPWTKAECEKLADVMDLEDPDEWLRRFNLVGGKPRFLFSPSEKFDDLVKRLNDGIPSTLGDLERMITRLLTQGFNDSMKHLMFLFLREENSPSRFYLAFSSLAVEAMVSSRYEIYSADQIRSILRTPEPNLQSWRGKEIEKFLLQGLATKRFCMKPLEGKNVGIVTHYGPFSAKSKIIQAASDIKASNKIHEVDKMPVMYIPLSKTFPAIDGVLVVPSAQIVIYAQSTVAESHSIKYQLLKDVYEELTKRGGFSKYTHILLFIVPVEVYDRFKFQSYMNTNKGRRTTRIDIKMMQYVGKITEGA